MLCIASASVSQALAGKHALPARARKSVRATAAAQGTATKLNTKRSEEVCNVWLNTCVEHEPDRFIAPTCVTAARCMRREWTGRRRRRRRHSLSPLLRLLCRPRHPLCRFSRRPRTCFLAASTPLYVPSRAWAGSPSCLTTSRCVYACNRAQGEGCRGGEGSRRGGGGSGPGSGRAGRGRGGPGRHGWASRQSVLWARPLIGITPSLPFVLLESSGV